MLNNNVENILSATTVGGIFECLDKEKQDYLFDELSENWEKLLEICGGFWSVMENAIDASSVQFEELKEIALKVARS